MASTAPAQKEDRIVFRSESDSFSIGDVIDAAHFRGEVASHWEGFLARVEATRAANESDATLDSAALDAAAVAFRYRYDLITADETECWLEARGLTLADFSNYFAREYWGNTLGVKSTVAPSPFHEASPELRDLFTVELILSGEFEAMARRLSWRIAAQRSYPIGSDRVEAQRILFFQRNGLGAGGSAKWLSDLGREEAWLEKMLAMEAAFQQQCAELLTPESVQREINLLRLPLTRFDVETIEFDSRDAASEAIWCVRNDGMSMEEVAHEGRYPYRRGELLLEKIAEDLQQKFLSVKPGSVLDPISREDGFQVSRLLGKVEPRADDPDVRARINSRITQRYFENLTSKHIRWEIQPSCPE